MVLDQQVGARHKTSKKITIINDNTHINSGRFLRPTQSFLVLNQEVKAVSNDLLLCR